MLRAFGEAFHGLPLLLLALIIFVSGYLIAGVIFIAVAKIAKKRETPTGLVTSLLSPLGTIFGLLAVFIMAQVWDGVTRAEAALEREASALRMIVLLAGGFPPEIEAKLKTLVRIHIDEIVRIEWPAMAQHAATLEFAPLALADALKIALAFSPVNEGQITAQREIVTVIETALDARRQRIILSQGRVDPVKWTCLFVQATVMLVAIAFLHSKDRTGAWIALTLFVTGVSVSVLLIVSHDLPFTGELAIKPDVLRQVRP